MDNILGVLLSWQFGIFSLSIFAITFILRTVGEYLFKYIKIIAKESKLWTELILPILPVVLGPITAILITTYPYPEGLSTVGSRFVFGLVAGLLCTLLYRIIKAQLKQVAKKVLNLFSATKNEEELTK